MTGPSNEGIEPVCGFCGRGPDEVAKLIAGQTAAICDDCVKLNYDLISGNLGGIVRRGEGRPATEA